MLIFEIKQNIWNNLFSQPEDNGGVDIRYYFHMQENPSSLSGPSQFFALTFITSSSYLKS